MPLIKYLSYFTLLIGLLYSCCRPCLPVGWVETPTIEKSKSVFIDWAKEQKLSLDITQKGISKKVLQKIATDIGDAKVVMISEGFHNCEEMLFLQSQLIPYLIQEKGFNTLVTESGLPESKFINDYIHGKDSIANMWQNSIGIMYAAWQQGRNTINWLRDYNTKTTVPIDYYGLDIGGFYRDWEFPFEQIFDYLNQVDTVVGKQLKQSMSFYFEQLKPYPMYYHMTKLDIAQKNQLATVLEELVQTFQKNKTAYIAKSNAQKYAWIKQCVQAMYQADYYYRNYECMVDSNDVGKCTGLNGREIAMANNLKWVLKQKKEAKVIVINHVVHTKTASQFQGGFYGNFVPMGQLLKQHLADDLYIVGMVYGGGQFWNRWHAPSLRYIDTIPAIPTGGMESVFGAVDSSSSYYLNFDQAPDMAQKWLNTTTTMRENDYQIKIQAAEWDATFYLHQATPAALAK